MSAHISTGSSSSDHIDAVLDLIDRALSENDIRPAREMPAERFAALLDELGLRAPSQNG